MDNLSEAVHTLWVEMQLGAPPTMQRTLLPLLHRAKEIGRLLVQPFMPLYELKGNTDVGPLTVTYGGLGYFKPLLKQMLFKEEPVERHVGRIFVWNPNIKIPQMDSDMTVIESGEHLTQKLPRQGALVLPFRVLFMLDIQGEWEAVEQRFRANTRRNIRRARRYENYELEVSQCEENLKMFYREMYVPTMDTRHRGLAVKISEKEACRLLHYGLLFLVKRNGAYVCGSLGLLRQSTIEFREMGVRNGDFQLMRDGVVDAMNYMRIHWAYRHGYKAVSLGDGWPFFTGVFLFKRKWGAVVSLPSYEHKRIWIKIQRCTPSVSEFLKKNPCVIIDSTGQLRGLIITDDLSTIGPDSYADWQAHYDTAGLSGLVAGSVAGLAAGQDLTELQPGFYQAFRY